MTHSTISRYFQLSGKVQFPAASKKVEGNFGSWVSSLHTNPSLNTSYWDLQSTLHIRTHFTLALTVHSDQHSELYLHTNTVHLTSVLIVHTLHKHNITQSTPQCIHSGNAVPMSSSLTATWRGWDLNPHTLIKGSCLLLAHIPLSHSTSCCTQGLFLEFSSQCPRSGL